MDWIIHAYPIHPIQILYLTSSDFEIHFFTIMFFFDTFSLLSSQKNTFRKFEDSVESIKIFVFSKMSLWKQFFLNLFSV